MVTPISPMKKIRLLAVEMGYRRSVSTYMGGAIVILSFWGTVLSAHALQNVFAIILTHVALVLDAVAVHPCRTSSPHKDLHLGPGSGIQMFFLSPVSKMQSMTNFHLL